MSLHYSLDSLLVRGGRLFGWGFCLDTAVPFVRGELVVQLSDGREHIVPLLPGGYREDLVLAYPASPHAGGAGFMVQAALPAPLREGIATLRFARDDGGSAELRLERFPTAYAPPEAIPMRSVLHRFGQVRRERGLVAAAVAAVRGARLRLGVWRSRRSEASLGTLRRAVLVLDHGMGGGANRYREERLAACLRDGRSVVLVTPVASTLDYRVEVCGNGHRRGFPLATLDEVLRRLDGVDAAVLEVNSLVGFDDVPEVLAWARRWREERAERRLRFHLHDFHSVCPAFTLVDAGGRFCGIPDTAVCRRCLPANALSTLGLDTHRDIPAWREAWLAFLRRCDELVAYSASSQALLARAFPSLAPASARVEPHGDAAAGMRTVRQRWLDPPRVAVVGHLNRAKGADLLRALARASEAAGSPLHFVVFGTVEGGSEGIGTLRVLGRYERAELCERLEAEGVALALLPSICPETYSYVADELMATGLPLAVLDRGAPAERVARYPRGRVLAGEEPAALLRQLVEFTAALRGTDTTGSITA